MAVRRRARRGVRLVAAAVTAVAVLAGCAGQPGAAAVVDGRSISTAELATAYEQLAPIFAGAGAQDVLGVLITEPFAAQVASDRGVGVNDEQALDLLRQVATQALGEEKGAELEFGPGAIAVGRYSLAASALRDLSDADAAAAEYQDLVRAADIDVNPRFGSFDADTLAVALPSTPSWIVPDGGRVAADGSTDDEADVPDPTPTS